MGATARFKYVHAAETNVVAKAVARSHAFQYPIRLTPTMRPKYSAYYLVWIRHREKKSPPKSESLQQTANAKAPKSAGGRRLIRPGPRQ